jgi:hypothetical protein
MELNLTELKTMNPYDTFDYNSYEQQNLDNYWENPKVEENPIKRKKVSFNDILSNMNLVVNKEGVLQFMGPNRELNYNSIKFNEQQHKQPYNQPYNQPYQQPKVHQPKQNKSSQPIEQSVKHSYIYNKYFTDYIDPNYEKPRPRVPKTIQEYHQMLLEDKIKAIEHRKMVEQVKSKKMIFTSAPGSGLNPRNLKASKNNLRIMNFR